MRVLKLNRNEQQYFLEMDPLMLMERGNVGDSYVLGGVLEDESTGTDIPVGLAVCSETEDTLMIIWLSISSKYRRQGYASELMNEIILRAVEGKKKYIGAYFENSFLRKTLCLGEREFFQGRGFIRRQSLSGEWFSDVKTALKQLNFEKRPDGHSVNAMSEFPKTALAQYMTEIIANENTAVLSKLERRSREFDEAVGQIMLDRNGHVTGALLVDTIGDVLYPVAFLADSTEKQRELIYEALNAAAKKYGRDMPIHVILQTERFAGIMNSLLPEMALENYVLFAETEELLQEYAFDDSLYDPYPELPEDFNLVVQVNDLKQYLKAGPDRSITLGEFARSKLVKEQKLPEQVEAISSLSMREFLEALMDCSYYGYSGVFECKPNQFCLEWFAPEISCCIRENGRVTNLLLIHESEDGSLRPLLLFAKGAEYRQNLTLLVRFACLTALEQYPEDSVINIRCHDELSTALCDKLIQ